MEILSIENYMNIYQELGFFPTVTAEQAGEVILKEVDQISERRKINAVELKEELRKINPLILTLIAAAYEDYGYNSF